MIQENGLITQEKQIGVVKVPQILMLITKLWSPTGNQEHTNSWDYHGNYSVHTVTRFLSSSSEDNGCGIYNFF